MTVNPVAVIRYQYDNHLGSASLELDDSGAIISYEEYHPFGTTSYRSGRTETETSQKRYKYVGKERDEETGLYYYGFRYYAAWLCRFVSVDPLQFEYPHYTPFQYAGNKPISYIDLDGLEEYYPDASNARAVAMGREFFWGAQVGASNIFRRLGEWGYELWGVEMPSKPRLRIVYGGVMDNVYWEDLPAYVEKYDASGNTWSEELMEFTGDFLNASSLFIGGKVGLNGPIMAVRNSPLLKSNAGSFIKRKFKDSVKKRSWFKYQAQINEMGGDVEFLIEKNGTKAYFDGFVDGVLKEAKSHY